MLYDLTSIKQTRRLILLGGVSVLAVRTLFRRNLGAPFQRAGSVLPALSLVALWTGMGRLVGLLIGSSSGITASGGGVPAASVGVVV